MTKPKGINNIIAMISRTGPTAIDSVKHAVDLALSESNENMKCIPPELDGNLKVFIWYTPKDKK